jgi:vancomycin permeability regulator SanA
MKKGRPTMIGKLWKRVCATVSRGIALFLGLFTILNVVGEVQLPGFDANLWWIQLPGNWQVVEPAMLCWSAGCLIWFATHRHFGRIPRCLLGLTFGLLLAAGCVNVLDYFRLLNLGQIQSASPFPFSLLVIVCLGLLFFELVRSSPDPPVSSRRADQTTVGLVCLICGLLFPLAQMICFGLTDYRRPADVIVVFGAKVHKDGRVSSIVEERVVTACELYQQGLAPQILLSGGPGVGEIHETEGMRRRAIELGVPATAILVDLNGVDTESTAINTLEMAPSQSWKRILAVSQFYHLPRIKLAFHRHRSEVYTVPAERIYRFPRMQYFMLREVAAWWLYYVRPLF